LGNPEINDTLRRLDDLTKEEALAAVAQAFDEAHRARDEVSRVAGGVERVEREVKGIKNRVEEGKMNDCLGYLDGAQTIFYKSSI
jgi:hypothetical protein